MSDTPRQPFFMVFYTFILALGLSGCSSETPKSVPKVTEFRSYPINIDRPKLNFNQAFESIEFIQLEETDQSLLGDRDQVIVFEDKFILSGYDDGRVITFSNKGKYLSHFDHRGDAEGQYTGMRNIWVEDDTIGIYDGDKETAHWYSLNGKHVKSLKMPANTSHMLPFNNGYIADMSLAPLSDPINYKAWLLNDQLGTEKQLVPFTSQVAFKMGTSNNSFSYLDEQLIFNAVYADTSYLIGPEEAKPLFHIDFGEKYAWKDEAVKTGLSSSMMAVSNGESVWKYESSVGDDYIYLKYYLFLDDLVAVIDRKTGAYELINHFTKSEERYDIIPVVWEGDRLLFSMPSSSVANLLEGMEEGQYKFTGNASLESIEASENLVLFWGEFKEITN